MPVLGETRVDGISSSPLTDEEKEVLAKKMAVMDKLLSDKNLAKYKIDLLFGADYSTHKPSVGALSFWESGAKLHGGGDCKLYICPASDRKVANCSDFIPDPSQGYGFLVCPKCGNMWQGKEVVGEILARLGSNGWAELLLKYFIKLGMNADLRIKYPPGDIRAATIQEREKRLHGELLDPLRARRAARIYLLKDIIKDVSSGADLYKRIYAFVTA